jgi:protein O-mannosyl-transferase
LEPKDARNASNYAIFLKNHRKDYDAADELYKKALELDRTDVKNTDNYANFLANQREDFDAAEELYKNALELDPKNPNSYANLASLKLRRGDLHSLGAVHALVRQVVRLSGRTASQAAAEALLYGALEHDLAPGGQDDGMLARLKGLLSIGFVRGSWDFDPMFAVTLPKLPAARHALYRSLGEAILDQSKVALLDAFSEWQSLESMDPFAPFIG